MNFLATEQTLWQMEQIFWQMNFFAERYSWLSEQTFWPTELWGRFNITTQVVECKEGEESAGKIKERKAERLHSFQIKSSSEQDRDWRQKGTLCFDKGSIHQEDTIPTVCPPNRQTAKCTKQNLVEPKETDNPRGRTVGDLTPPFNN